MKKIVHVITGLGDGGAEAVLYRLCKHDAQNAHVVVSLMDDGKYGSLLRKSHIRVFCLRMPRRRVTISGLYALYRIFLNEKPDLVQTWMYHANLIGGILARIAGVDRVIWGIHNSTLNAKTSAWSTIFVNYICSLLSHFIPSIIVSCSQNAVEIHKSLGYCHNKFAVIPNGYDFEEFKPDDHARRTLRSEWTIDDKVPLLGMVARFDSQKDHKTLISALGMLQRTGCDFRCVLVGAMIDSNNRELLTWIRQENIEDKTLLLGPRNDIPAVMNALDLHILSSRGEAFPNVLVEAMACGTPCITTDVGDAALIVGETGWVVQPSDPKALSRKITTAINYINNQDNESLFKYKCRMKIFNQYSIYRMVNNYSNIYYKINSQSGEL